MKTITKGKRLLLIVLLILLLVWPVYQAGLRLSGELRYYFKTPSQAEQTVHTYARENGLRYSDYPQELIALLERNAETETFVLEYPLKKGQAVNVDLSQYSTDRVPLFLQWDQQWGYLPYGSGIAAITGCGPMCLSMAGFYLTGNADFSPDKMLSFATDNGYYAAGYGSSWTLISEGAGKLGLKATELPLVKSRIFNNLEAGNPVICVMGPGDFTTTGHFIIMVGCKDGMIQVNDPNSISNSEKLWRYEDIEGQIRNLWALETA